MLSVLAAVNMWRITAATSLKNLRQLLLKSNVNTVKFYHANGGCFGFRPIPHVTLKG